MCKLNIVKDKRAHYLVSKEEVSFCPSSCCKVCHISQEFVRLALKPISNVFGLGMAYLWDNNLGEL